MELLEIVHSFYIVSPCGLKHSIFVLTVDPHMAYIIRCFILHTLAGLLYLYKFIVLITLVNC